jgi:hypothetical protein
VVHPHSAGIDVGNSAHYVAVRPDRDPEPARRFECFTAVLYRLAGWLQWCRVKTVALQRTGYIGAPSPTSWKNAPSSSIWSMHGITRICRDAERCAGAAEITRLRVIEQLVSTTFRDSSTAYRLAATSTTREWSGDLRSTNLQSTDTATQMNVQCRRQRNTWAAINHFVNRNRTLLSAECCCNCEAWSLYSRNILSKPSALRLMSAIFSGCKPIRSASSNQSSRRRNENTRSKSEYRNG